MPNGCYVIIHANKSFNPPSLTVAGPTVISDLAAAFGSTWKDQIDSIQVGPDAVVRLYQNKGLGKGEQYTFLPGESVADFSLIGASNEADGMKIYQPSCGGLTPPY